MPPTVRPGASSRSSIPGPSGTPSKPRRESATKALAAITGKSLATEVEIEDFHPPTWRSVLSTRADLGYPDFYPSRPGFGQAEDVLTEDNVKNGFTAKPVPAAGAESFSMHGPINQFFLNGGIKTISSFADDVLRLRESSMPAIGDRSFRIPPRVTYNDTKRLQFLSDLANPEVPLSRLMRSNVPYGFKGVELFDTMYSPSTTFPPVGANRAAPGKGPADPIPIDRAVWFIRVLGASDIAFHRGRVAPIASASAPSPAAPPTPSSNTTVAATPTLQISSNDWHTQEFTLLYTSWLRIQLSQLQLPAIPKVKNAPPPKLPLGVLGDEQARSKWLAKWEYSCTLLREFHDRRFLSNRVLMSWMSDHLANANLAQVGFVGELIAQYLPHMARHIWIGRQCVRVICDRIVEVRASPAADALHKVEKMLEYILTALVEAEPEVLLSPITWRQHGRLLTTVLGLETARENGHAAPPASPAISPGVWQSLQRRNAALLYTPTSSESMTSPRRHQLEEIHKLDSLGADTNMPELCKSFFDGPTSPTASPLDLGRLSEKISILLNWALAVHQLGIHRPYGVYTLIKMWQERRDKFAAKNKGTPPIDLFPILYDWLDTSSAARKENNVPAIGILFGEFTRQGLFSFGRYIQTLIARGQTARTRPTGPPSHHLALLRGMPIFVQAKDLLQQRRIALCGDDLEAKRRDEAAEERLMAEYKEECKEYVPEVFDLKPDGRSATMRDAVNPQKAPLQGVSRHIFLQVRFWIFPAAAERLPPSSKTPLDASTFVRVMQIYRMGLGYSTIADFLIKAIQLSEDEEIFRIVVDTLRRDADVWTAMDRWKQLSEALMERHQKMETDRQFNPGLSEILRELADQGRLPREDAEDVRAYARSQRPTQTPAPKGLNPKESLDQLAALLRNGDDNAAEAFVPKLISRLGLFDGWSGEWWVTIIETLESAKPGATAESSLTASLVHARKGCETARSSLDPTVTAWLEPLDPSLRLEKLSNPNGLVKRFLLHLVISRCLSTMTLLEHLMVPMWKYASSICVLPGSQLVSPKMLIAVDKTISLAAQLLLNSPPDGTLPPATLQESLIAQTSRAAILQGANVLALIRALPYLVVLQSAKITSAETKDRIATFLESIATIPQFKTAAFRHLDTLKDTFLSAEWTKSGMDPAVEAGMVDTLKAIMSEGSSGSSITIPALGSGIRLSAWRWTRVVLEMRLEFKRLAMRIESKDDAKEARGALRKMIQGTLERDISPDDADLLCETLKGIEPVVAGEILGVGLDRLGGLLSSVLSADTADAMRSINASIDLILRVLDTAKSPSSISDQGILVARHKLVDLLAVALQSVESHLSPSADSPALPIDASPAEPGETFSMVSKLLRFALGLRVADSSSPVAPRVDFSKLAVAYFKVISLLSAETSIGEDVRDMLLYILDSAPPQSRSTLWATLIAEASALASSENAVDLADALPYASPPRRYTSLSGPLIHDGTGDSSIHLDDRPWELFEQMDPPPAPPPHQLKFLGFKPVKDTSSIPMAFFNPQIKRDEVPADLAHVDDEVQLDDEEDTESTWPWRGYASERNLGDGFAGEPVSARQFASRMFGGLDEALIEEELARSPVISTADAAASPSNSISAVSAMTRPRRMSIRLASTASLAGVKGSSRDPITIEEDESSDEDSDSEIEEEAPPTKRTRLNSTASKTTATASKHPATGGKAPARKTTGGKNVGRKATGGKRYGGKAPSKGAKRRD